MIKILHSADWHIVLHRKNIPTDWQANRFREFFRKLRELESECQINIIAGDIFDRKPEPDEVCLFLSYVNSVTIPTYIIPGNHEATRKGQSFLEHFLEEHAISNPLVKIMTKNTFLEESGVSFCFFPYGEMQLDHLPEQKGDVLVTHIRGEVPPHISEEYDFEKLRGWSLILLGDIHFNHQYKDFPAYYSGSPMNVNFDRDETKEYGVNLIEYRGPQDYSVEFRVLDLPRLIRRTVEVGGQMIQDDYHHVVYEVKGSIDELSKINHSPLIDKKIAHKPSEEAKLVLKEYSLLEELDLYLKHIKISNHQEVLDEFLGLHLDGENYVKNTT